MKKYLLLIILMGAYMLNAQFKGFEERIWIYDAAYNPMCEVIDEWQKPIWRDK